MVPCGPLWSRGAPDRPTEASDAPRSFFSSAPWKPSKPGDDHSSAVGLGNATFILIVSNMPIGHRTCHLFFYRCKSARARYNQAHALQCAFP